LSFRKTFFILIAVFSIAMVAEAKKTRVKCKIVEASVTDCSEATTGPKCSNATALVVIQS